MPTSQPEKFRIVDVIISGMATNAFAAVTTLPPFCLGTIQKPDPRKIVLERFSNWQADIIACMIVLETLDGTDNAKRSLDALLRTAEQLRDAFLQLTNWQELSSEALLAVHGSIDSAYRDIEAIIEICGKALGFPFAFLADRRKLKKIGHRRDIEGLLKQLQDIVSSRKVEGGH